MNIKLISVISALAVSAAVAQDYDDEYEEDSAPAAAEAAQEEEAPAAPAPAAEPAPAAPVFSAEPEEAAAPAPAEQATGLNVLHGRAYNIVGNEAAASTVRGNMAVPYKMAGSKLFYVEPTDKYGALALGSGSMTYLLAFDRNGANLGMFTAGIATKAFGVTVDVALDKKWGSGEVKSDNSKGEGDVSVTKPNDYIGATFAAPLGAVDLTINAYWNTYALETDKESGDVEHDEDYWDLGGSLALTNGPSGSALAWSVGAAVVRHKDFSKDVDFGANGAKETREATGPTANTLIQPYFNIGFPVLSNAESRVLLGLNTRLPLVFFDELDNKGAKTKDSYSIFGLYTSPNILAEMNVSENWIIFGGASFDWEVFSYASDEYTTNYDTPNAKEITDISIMGMKTNATIATAGARFQYKNLSVEASVAQDLTTAAWEGLIGNFSGTLSF